MKYLWGSLIIFTIACVVIAIYGISVRHSKPEIQGVNTEIIYDTVPGFTENESNDLELKVKIAIYKNGYLTGALRVLKEGTWDESFWKKDSVLFYKLLNE